VDISHGGLDAAVADVVPGVVVPARTRELLTVTAWSAAAVLAVVAVDRLIGLMLRRGDEFSSFAPYGGWQLYGVVAALGLVAIVTGSVGLLRARRLVRQLNGRTPYRRVAVMAAILPGLFLGIGTVTPMRGVMSWASNHTAAAASARAQDREWFREYKKGPPTVTYRGVTADDARLAFLLDPRALGTDWHATFRAPITPSTAAPNVLAVAQGVYGEAHWLGQSWQQDWGLIENLTIFQTANEARSYVAQETRKDTEICACTTAGVMTTRNIAGVEVHVRTTYVVGYTPSRRATFAVGNHSIRLFAIPPLNGDNKAPSFDALLRAAVKRAAITP